MVRLGFRLSVGGTWTTDKTLCTQARQIEGSKMITWCWSAVSERLVLLVLFGTLLTRLKT